MLVKAPYTMLGYRYLIGHENGDELTALSGSDDLERAKEQATNWSRAMRGVKIVVHHGEVARSLWNVMPVFAVTAFSDKGIPLPRPQNPLPA